MPGAALAQPVPPPDLGEPAAPGMFALAHPDRPRQILNVAGWHDIAVTSRHTPILVGGGGTLDDTVDLRRTGSMGRTMLAGVDPDTQDRAVSAVREALAPFADDGGVRLEAAVWLLTARG